MECCNTLHDSVGIAYQVQADTSKIDLDISNISNTLFHTSRQILKFWNIENVEKEVTIRQTKT